MVLHSMASKDISASILFAGFLIISQFTYSGFFPTSFWQIIRDVPDQMGLYKRFNDIRAWVFNLCSGSIVFRTHFWQSDRRIRMRRNGVRSVHVSLAVATLTYIKLRRGMAKLCQNKHYRSFGSLTPSWYLHRYHWHDLRYRSLRRAIVRWCFYNPPILALVLLDQSPLWGSHSPRNAICSENTV